MTKSVTLIEKIEKLLYLKSGVGEIEKVALTSESKKRSRSLPYWASKGRPKKVLIESLKTLDLKSGGDWSLKKCAWSIFKSVNSNQKILSIFQNA